MGQMTQLTVSKPWRK